MSKIILASQSPRRRELLELCNIPFTVISSDAVEVFNTQVPIAQAIVELAYTKALAVFKDHPDCIVIGADTVVVHNDTILGKPLDEEDACKMLESLSGKIHSVITGVTILSKDKQISFHSETKVKMFPLTAKEIHDYVASGEPLDRAGAYAIQEKGALLVEWIEGDYYTVMGLPIALVNKELKKLLNDC